MNTIDKEFIQYTEKDALDLVSEDGLNLRFIKNQTHKICAAAIENDIQSLMFIKNPTLALMNLVFRHKKWTPFIMALRGWSSNEYIIPLSSIINYPVDDELLIAFSKLNGPSKNGDFGPNRKKMEAFLPIWKKNLLKRKIQAL